MLSRATLETYRRMKPDERLALTIEAIRTSTPYLVEGRAEIVDRRFESIRRENDARNRALLEGLAAAQQR